MPDRELGQPFDGLLEALREERRRCPDSDRLLDHAEGRLSGAERETMELHLAICVECADLVERARAPAAEVDDVAWARVARNLDSRDRPWRGREGRPAWRNRWLAAAAVVALVAGGFAALLVSTRPDGPVAAVRGASIHALAPPAEVASPDEAVAFEWSSVLPAEVDFRLEVASGGEIVWRGTTEGTRLEVPADLRERLAAGQELRWRVLGVAPTGAVVLESAWTPLRLRGAAAAPSEAEDEQGGERRGAEGE